MEAPLPDTMQTGPLTVGDLLDQMPARGIGDNSAGAPLVELLAEETAPLRTRAAELLAAVERVETAENATVLAGLMKACLARIEAEREERKRPFLESGRAVDAHYNGIAGMLATTERGKLLGGPLKLLLDKVAAEVRRKEAEAATERRRIEEEARQAREAAAAAERDAADEKATADRRLASEIESRAAADRAAALERQAAEVKAAPLTTELGVKAHARTEWSFEITDEIVALKHAIKVDRTAIRTAVEDVIRRQVRAKVREFPGARIFAVTAASIRQA